MEREVTILRDEPTIIPLAEMHLEPLGVEAMMDWVESHRPECLPDRAPEELKRWDQLFPHNLHEGDRPLTSNELLVELAGRKCFDGETEVLTEAGWKLFAALQQEEAVATFNRDTGLLEFQVPTQHIQKRHVGPMYSVRSRGLSLRVTGDHEMWCQRGAAPWGLCAAALLLGQKYRVQRAATYLGRAFAEPLWEVPKGKERSWATFLGYYLSEGSLVDGRRYGVGSRVTVYQRPETAGPYMAALADLGLAPKVYVDSRNGVLQIALHNTCFADALAVLGDLAQTKRLPDHVFHWPLGIRAALLDALMAGDGTRTKGHRVYTTTSALLAEGVQRLITLSGLPSSISSVAPNTDPKGTSFRGNHVVHRVREGSQVLISVNNKAEHDTLEEVDETVYCVSVPNRILLVRREGRTMLCANCYDSFGLKAGKKSNAEYIAHTQGGDIPHACYDEATEVLTESGWKRWDAVTMEDRLATRASDGALVYQRPEALNDSYYNGKMYRVDGGFVDLLVTPNHRMYVCLTTTREGRERASFDFITAEELDGHAHCYVKNATWKGGRASTQHHRDVSALLGFALGDGCATHQGPLRFHLKKQRKISWLRAVTQRLGWELKEQAGDAYVVQVPENYIGMFWNMYDENGEKHIPQCYFVERDRAELEALLDGLLQSDGHKSETNINYSSTSLRLLDQVQQLALHVGLAAHLHVDQKQCAHVNLIRRGLKPEVNRGAVLPRTRWETYSGRVFCAQVPNGTLYVRRNGIPVWCGNSIMYHAKVTFFFAGISRRVSHELIRNYVGADRDEEGSPSQESTRFTHHYGFFIEPPRYAELCRGTTARHQEMMQNLFKGSMQSAYNNYLQAIGEEVAEWERLHGKPPTSLDKKRIYEAASSFLPHQAETSFVWTTNPSAIAKLVRERANSAADLEIQRFARKLRRVAVSRAPNLYPQPWMREET